VKTLIEKAKESNLDEDVKIMLPNVFRGLSKIYYRRIDVLSDIYLNQISSFITQEIEKNIGGSNNFMKIEVFGEKEKKHREQHPDSNF